MFDRWKESKSLKPLQIALELKIDNWNVVCTHVTQDRTRHPGFPAMQLRLTCDQIRTESESLHVKYGAKEKKRNGNNWEP